MEASPYLPADLDFYRILALLRYATDGFLNDVSPILLEKLWRFHGSDFWQLYGNMISLSLQGSSNYPPMLLLPLLHLMWVTNVYLWNPDECCCSAMLHLCILYMYEFIVYSLFGKKVFFGVISTLNMLLHTSIPSIYSFYFLIWTVLFPHFM